MSENDVGDFYRLTAAREVILASKLKNLPEFKPLNSFLRLKIYAKRLRFLLARLRKRSE